MKIDYPRSAWGARPAARVTPLDWHRVTDLIIHYPGEADPIGTDPARIAAALRSMQAYHMAAPPKGRGWSDLAYSFAVDQAGRIWEGRGWASRDGATSGHGGTSASILALVANDEQPSDLMLSAILGWMDDAQGRCTHIARRGWHSAYVSTTCPGNALRAWGMSGFPAPAAPNTPSKEIEMVTPEDRKAIAADVVWSLAEFRPDQARNLWDMLQAARQDIGVLVGQLAGLTAAVGQLAQGQPLSLDEVIAASAAAAREAVSTIKSIDTTVTIKKEA